MKKMKKSHRIVIKMKKGISGSPGGGAGGDGALPGGVKRGLH